MHILLAAGDASSLSATVGVRRRVAASATIVRADPEHGIFRGMNLAQGLLANGSIFEVLQYPRHEKLLRRKARRVRDEEFGTDAVHAFAQKLGDTMMAHRALGLAATQVAEAPGEEPWAMFAMRIGDESFGVVCNPEIVDAGQFRTGVEACLSFASVRESMPAPESLTLRGRNPAGAEFTLVLSMVQARCARHEVEHLAGKLMIDGMSPMKRQMFLKQVQKARRR